MVSPPPAEAAPGVDQRHDADVLCSTSRPAAACGSATRRRPRRGFAAGSARDRVRGQLHRRPAQLPRRRRCSLCSTSRCGTATPTAPTALSNDSWRHSSHSSTRRSRAARRCTCTASRRAPRRDGRRVAAHAQTRVGRGVGDRRRQQLRPIINPIGHLPGLLHRYEQARTSVPVPAGVAEPLLPRAVCGLLGHPRRARAGGEASSARGARRAESRKRWMDCARRSSRGARARALEGRLSARPRGPVKYYYNLAHVRLYRLPAPFVWVSL